MLWGASRGWHWGSSPAQNPRSSVLRRGPRAKLTADFPKWVGEGPVGRSVCLCRNQPSLPSGTGGWGRLLAGAQWPRGQAGHQAWGR